MRKDTVTGAPEQAGETLSEEAPDKPLAQDRRMTITFSQEAYALLEKLARRKGKSMSDVVRDAVAMEQWLEDSRQNGERFLIERDGQQREIVFRG